MKEMLFDRLDRFGWYALLMAMAGDVLISWILPVFYKDYSCLKFSISALGNPQSPVRIPFNIWMLLEGILFLLSQPVLYKCFHDTSHGLTNVLIAFTAIFAIGACIFTCFFSVNESKDIVTVASKIHGFGSVLGFMLFLFVPLIVAILSFKENDVTVGIISIISFVVSLFFFVLFVMADKPEFSNTRLGNEGLWQRLNLVFMYVPLIIVAIKNIMSGMK